MGATPSCPLNTSFVVDACYPSCPNGTAGSTLYRSLCISTVPCPSGTTDDVTGLTCEKVVTDNGIVAKTEDTCDGGYTEWVTGFCYKDCPTTHLENGKDCKKKTVLRDQFTPMCSVWFTDFANGECNLDYGKVLLLVTAFVVIRYYITKK